VCMLVVCVYVPIIVELHDNKFSLVILKVVAKTCESQDGETSIE